MDNDNDDVRNNQTNPLLVCSVHFESFHFILFLFFIFQVIFMLQFLYIVLFFRMPLFSSIDFCL